MNEVQYLCTGLEHICLFSQSCLFISFVNFFFSFQFNSNGFVEAPYIQGNVPFMQYEL